MVVKGVARVARGCSGLLWVARVAVGCQGLLGIARVCYGLLRFAMGVAVLAKVS